MKQAKDLVDVLTEANQTINPKLMDLVEMAKSFSFGKSRKWGGNNSSRSRGRFDGKHSHPYERNQSRNRYDNRSNGGFNGKDDRYGNSASKDTNNYRYNARNDSYGNSGTKGTHKIFA